MNPRDVTSPQDRWRLIDVLHETPDWAMAVGRWRNDDGTWRPVLGQRWNGSADSKGTPTAHGWAIWFVVPDETYDLFLESNFIPPAKRAFVREILEIPEAA